MNTKGVHPTLPHVKDFLHWDTVQREILHEVKSCSNHIISSFTLLSNFYSLAKLFALSLRTISSATVACFTDTAR
jgi:hypothetical protein